MHICSASLEWRFSTAVITLYLGSWLINFEILPNNTLKAAWGLLKESLASDWAIFQIAGFQHLQYFQRLLIKCSLFGWLFGILTNYIPWLIKFQKWLNATSMHIYKYDKPSSSLHYLHSVIKTWLGRYPGILVYTPIGYLSYVILRV